MRIGLDLRPFLRQETGVGVYLRNLLFGLAGIDRDNEYCLISSSWKDRFPRDKIPPFSKLKFRDLRIPVRALNFLWNSWQWPPLETFFGGRLDLSHSPTPLPLPSKGKKIVTVCDLFFLEDPDKADLEARRVFSKKARTSLERADGIITISRFSRDSIVKACGIAEDKILVTYLGTSPGFKEKSSPEELDRTRRELDLPAEFLLFVGASEPRKNLGALLDALSLVHREYKPVVLVIAGREGGDAETLSKKVKDLNLGAWVKFTGYLSERDIRNLYHLAAGLAFPSLCEGFGLPLLEAMACGLPAAAASAGALPEIAGRAALFFNPHDPQDMARALIRLLSDGPLRQDLIREGLRRAGDFDWARTASQTLDFYKRVTGMA